MTTLQLPCAAQPGDVIAFEERSDGSVLVTLRNAQKYWPAVRLHPAQVADLRRWARREPVVDGTTDGGSDGES